MADANVTRRTIPLQWLDCLEGYNSRLFAIHTLVIGWMSNANTEGLPENMDTLIAGLHEMMTGIQEDYQSLHDEIDGLRQAYIKIDRQHD
jgi:hypothetical protein